MREQRLCRCVDVVACLNQRTLRRRSRETHVRQLANAALVWALDRGHARNADGAAAEDGSGGLHILHLFILDVQKLHDNVDDELADADQGSRKPFRLPDRMDSGYRVDGDTHSYQEVMRLKVIGVGVLLVHGQRERGLSSVEEGSCGNDGLNELKSNFEAAESMRKLLLGSLRAFFDLKPC